MSDNPTTNNTANLANPNNQPKTGPVPPRQQWQPPVQATQTQPTIPQVDPSRERVDREEVTQIERRRRKGGSLNRMVQFKLDFIPEEFLDTDRYVYRWVNDEGSKIRMATRHDDYDYVNMDELGDLDPASFDSEGGNRIRMLVNQATATSGPLYAYLLKKRKDFWVADNEEVVRSREDMMAGRVYRAELGEEDDLKDANYARDNYYVPEGTSVGGAAQRKKGPIPKRVIR
jgi:hypothetical protein